MSEFYALPENPQYHEDIRKITREDTVDADEVVNPLIEKMLENTHAVKKDLEKLQTGAGSSTEIRNSWQDENGSTIDCVVQTTDTGKIIAQRKHLDDSKDMIITTVQQGGISGTDANGEPSENLDGIQAEVHTVPYYDTEPHATHTATLDQWGLTVDLTELYSVNGERCLGALAIQKEDDQAINAGLSAEYEFLTSHKHLSDIRIITGRDMVESALSSIIERMDGTKIDAEIKTQELSGFEMAAEIRAESVVGTEDAPVNSVEASVKAYCGNAYTEDGAAVILETRDNVSGGAAQLMLTLHDGIRFIHDFTGTGGEVTDTHLATEDYVDRYMPRIFSATIPATNADVTGSVSMTLPDCTAYEMACIVDAVPAVADQDAFYECGFRMRTISPDGFTYSVDSNLTQSITIYISVQEALPEGGYA